MALRGGDGLAYAKVMRAVGMLLLLVSSAGAQEAAEPAPPSCDPPCRKGYFCREGVCVSECNPVCPSNYICQNRECIADPNAPRVVAVQPTSGESAGPGKELSRNSFVGVGGGVRLSVSATGVTDLPSSSVVAIDTGSRYVGGGLALSFPQGGIVIVTDFIRAQFPLNLTSRWVLEPQFGISFIYGSFDDFAYQQLALVPGLRVRCDITNAFAVFLQAVRFDVAVYTNVSHRDPTLSGRVKDTLVYASMGAGVQVRY